MRTTPSRAAAAIAIGALVVSGGVLAATPASAAEQDIYTQSLYWELEDETGTAYYHEAYDYATSTEGWSYDAFDEAAVLSGNVCNTDWVFGTDSGGWATTGVVSAPNFVNGALSSFVIDWDLSTECDDHHIQATVTLEGNYAKWTYVLTGESFEDVNFGVDAYYDGDTLWDTTSADSVVGYDGDVDDFDDAPMAWKFATDGTATALTAVDGDDELVYSTQAPTTLTAIVLLPDYSYGTGLDAAYGYLLANADTLDDSFGQTLPIFYGTDAPAYGAQSATVGAAIDRTVPYTYSGIAVDGDPSDIDYFLGTDDDELIGFELGDVPPGLTISITFDPTTGLPIVRVTGTPTTVGSFWVPVTYFYQSIDDATDRWMPLTSSIEFTVAATAATTAGGSSLAATGADTTPFIGGALSLLIAGAAVLMVTRKRRNAAA